MAKDAKSRDNFWSRIAIPINDDWKENKLDFVNPTLVADMFAEATGIASALAGQIETLTEKLANSEFDKGESERELTAFRRDVLARNYKAITKSAHSEVKDAFILAMLRKEDVEGEGPPRAEARLAELECYRDETLMDIAVWKPQLERLQFRLKVLERNLDWAKQFIDYDKLQQRILELGRR